MILAIVLLKIKVLEFDADILFWSGADMKKRFSLPLLLGFVGLLFKPVTLPLKAVGFVGHKTASAAGRGTKATLRNVSLQAGFVKIRPFDFQ